MQLTYLRTYHSMTKVGQTKGNETVVNGSWWKKAKIVDGKQKKKCVIKGDNGEF